MKLSTFKSAERAAYRLMKVFEAEAKTDFAAKLLKETYTKLWLDRHEAWKRAAVAIARRRDKGVVLFEIFVPQYGGITVYTRTPSLVITTSLSKDSWSPTGYKSYSEPHVEIVNNKFWSPAYHFNFYMGRKEGSMNDQLQGGLERSQRGSHKPDQAGSTPAPATTFGGPPVAPLAATSSTDHELAPRCVTAAEHNAYPGGRW